jgi:hypothetical protein
MQINYYAEIIHADYHFKCDYNFSVDGASYSGGVVCEKSIVDEAIRGKRLGQSGSLPIPNAVVYYNPADPSMNSLKEFSAMSEDDYRMGAGLIGVGVFTIVFVVWGAVLAANQQSENHRMFVEATRRTVTHPEEINYNLGSDGLFNKGRKTERGYAAANGQVGNAADSDPLHGLRELYLNVVNHIHPDRALNEPDRAVRERLMKEANAAFKRGDAEMLRSLLEEYRTAASL